MILKLENGNKQVTTRSPMVTGMYYPTGIKNLILIFRISHYATSSTNESVYIIGGYTNGNSAYRSTTIAEYKEGSWKVVGNLAAGRNSHCTTTSGYTTMVAGGNPYTSGSLLVVHLVHISTHMSH